MRTPFSIFRLLAISVGMPAVFVVLDQAALRYGAANRWSPTAGVVVSSWFAVLRSSPPEMDGAQWLHASADGFVLALVSLTALWAALGSGRWWLKLLVFVMFAVLAGAGLYWLEDTVRYNRNLFRPSDPLTYAGWRWLAWTLLTGIFLAGMLLVLRASGYRLVRRGRR